MEGISICGGCGNDAMRCWCDDEPVAVLGVAAAEMTDEQIQATIKLANASGAEDSALIDEGRNRGWWQ